MANSMNKPSWDLKNIKCGISKTTPETKQFVINDLGDWLELVIAKSWDIASKTKKVDYIMAFNAMISLLSMVLTSDNIKPNIFEEKEAKP